MRKVIRFFDVLEDKIRGKLSHHPLFYAFISGVGVVLFWRGVWHTADQIPYLQIGVVSLLVGTVILLLIGVFVSDFIGNRILLSGLRGEKKLTEKTQEEIKEEDAGINKIEDSILKIEEEIKEIQEEISRKAN